MMNKV